MIKQRDRNGNYLEVSGSAMVAYAILKSISLNILDKSYIEIAKKCLIGILKIHGFYIKDKLHIGGIVAVAGLGGDEGLRRDGSFDYYVSEKVAVYEAKGIGPLMSAYAEYLKLSQKFH